MTKKPSLTKSTSGIFEFTIPTASGDLVSVRSTATDLARLRQNVPGTRGLLCNAHGGRYPGCPLGPIDAERARLALKRGVKPD